jgi:4-hydroxybenzoate polyprenyltransferase
VNQPAERVAPTTTEASPPSDGLSREKIDAGPAADRIGPARALWRLTRPSFAFWLLWIPLIGFGFAHWDRALDWTNLRGFALLLPAWLLLNAGTMWLNAALDAQEAGALFATPGHIPAGVSKCGYAALAAGVLAGFGSSLWVGTCAAGCALLAVLYSHPATAWKGHPVKGPLVNALGYGVLSVCAGWSLVGVPMNLRTAITFTLLTLWLLGVTFCAQAFQRDDDLRRGYRTLVVTHGSGATLRAGRWCANSAVGAVLVLTIVGVFPRLCLLALPLFWVADKWMRRWQRQPEGGGPRWAAGYIQRMLAGGLVYFALAYADYLWDWHEGGPVAGAATRWASGEAAAPSW